MGRVRKKTCSVILVAWLIFAFSIVTPIKPAKAQDPSVEVYVDQPLGYLPFEAPGTKFTFTINITTSGLADGTTAGIIQWKMNIRVDPNVLDINTTVGTGFPPPYAAKFSTGPGHFLYEFAAMMGYGAPSMFFGTNDPLAGYQDDINEVGVPAYETGAGDIVSSTYPKLLTVEITSKNDTQGCLIDLIDVMYRTGDKVWHYADQVEDGYYGPPPNATFTYAPSEPLVGELVTFNASASQPDGGAIVRYAWDFGDDTTKIYQDANLTAITNHTYTEAGIYSVALNVTNDKGLWDTESKDVTVYGPPVANFTFSPSQPGVGESVTFNASASYDPDGGDIISYEWDFGDETTSTETDPIITHKFFVAGTYTVSLNVTDDEGSTNATSDTVTVSGAAAAAELDVEVDVGSIHFRGENAEFYILTSFMGEPVNATQINARLYYSGTLHEDLSGFVENVTTGLYRLPYLIAQDAPAGTYVLVVNATFFTQKGVSLKSFLISPTLTGWNALLININGTAGTIMTDVGLIEVKLDSINATLFDVNGTVATINSAIGLIAADVSTIDAKLTEINGTVVTINSTLGLIKTDITAINGKITTIEEWGKTGGILATIQSTLGSIEVDIDDVNGEISDIDGTLVTIQTDIGLIRTNVTAIHATIVDVQDGLVTLDSTLGAVQLDLEEVKDDISFELVGVVGDIEEGLANVTAAITDAEGNILAELGQVEVKLDEINAALTNIDGSLVTIGTDIGNIEGAITSIQGDVATIETDIGVIIAILEEWTGVTTSSITTPVGTFDIMFLTNSTLEDAVSFSDSTLTLVVSGEAGTTGTLSVMIPKQLLVGIGSNIDEFAVTINGSPVSFTYAEEAELYAVRIMYTHSVHTIRIHMAGLSEQPPLALWILLTIVLATATTAIGAALYTQKTQKKPAKP